MTHLSKILLTNSHLNQKGKIGVAVSGGVDSMVLLDLLIKNKKNLKAEVFALHYNHKWRKESDKDAKLIKKYCKKKGISFIYGESSGKIKKTEEEARDKRYKFLIKEGRKNKLDHICTAHHIDDQVETIIFRLLRGTGPSGLNPIKDQLLIENKVSIIRPFLKVEKDKIIKYAKKEKVQFLEDKSNKNTKYMRNLIRDKLLPRMKEVNSYASENLIRFSELAFSQDVLLSDFHSKLLKKISKGKEELNRNKFLQLTVEARKSFLYWYLNKKGIPGSISRLDETLRLIKEKKSSDLPNSFRLKVSKDTFSIKKKAAPKKKNRPKCLELSLDFKTQRTIKLPNKKHLLIRKLNSKKEIESFPSDKAMKAYVDLNKIENLNIRTREESDKFQPLGCKYKTKLKNYFINKKIPASKRDSLALLCFNNEVLWIPGIAVSERIKVKTSPSHIIEVISNGSRIKQTR